MIQQITILGGHGKDSTPEPVARIDLSMGQVISIVGPTGSGKTTFINDIELFANGDTPTGRRILIDGKTPPAQYREDPSLNPIALITQHTNFLSDLPVGEFLRTHAGIRTNDGGMVSSLMEKTLDFANQLTGEPVIASIRMTELSGGQTRALLIADATIICNTPIVLLDEVENAGIHRTRALELLRQYKKIFVFVTHDPRIALLSDARIVMQNGCVTQFIETDAAERLFAGAVTRIDDTLTKLRERIRMGGRMTMEDVREHAAFTAMEAKA
ncbi:MAG TPA: ATP-binding cassette domain-containing protein [Candidatus Hydrogenedentes bacterium]|nr:ATP-binding cassette domain-containing protein [Candidatus Hydrogenedentota bacterium]